MMYFEFIKNFLLANSSVLMAVMFVSYFLDMMYVVFMKNFLIADSNELMAVRLISASQAQKRLISTFLTLCTSNS